MPNETDDGSQVRMGRPPVEERKEPQQVLLEPRYIEQIENLARQRGTTKSALMRELLIKQLESDLPVYIQGLGDPKEWGEWCAVKGLSEDHVVERCKIGFIQKGLEGTTAQERQRYIQQALDAYRANKY